MKREGREIESKIEEAIRLAAGNALKAEPESGVDAALGRPRGEGVLSSGVATALAVLGSLLQGASGTTGAAETAGIKTTAGGWSSVAPTAITGLLTQRNNAGASNWPGLLSNLNPILGGILRLFGGGGDNAPRELPVAARPVTAKYELGFGGADSSYFFIDRDANGAPRSARTLASPTVVVQVEAMDSRSFMERTPEIAEAVKRALLESEGMQNVFAEWRE